MRSPSHWLTAAYGTQRSDAPSGLVAPERRAVPQGPGAQAVVPLGVRDSGTFARQRKRPVSRFSETSLSLGSARLQWPSRESKTPLVVTPTEWASQRDRESRLPEEEGHALLVGMTNDARGRRGEAAEGTGLQRSWLPRPALLGSCSQPVFQVSTPVPYLSEASDSELGELGEGVSAAPASLWGPLDPPACRRGACSRRQPVTGSVPTSQMRRREGGNS